VQLNLGFARNAPQEPTEPVEYLVAQRVLLERIVVHLIHCVPTAPLVLSLEAATYVNRVTLDCTKVTLVKHNA
jgi:hypothetical protein